MLPLVRQQSASACWPPASITAAIPGSICVTRSPACRKCFLEQVKKTFSHRFSQFWKPARSLNGGTTFAGKRGFRSLSRNVQKHGIDETMLYPNQRIETRSILSLLTPFDGLDEGLPSTQCKSLNGMVLHHDYCGSRDRFLFSRPLFYCFTCYDFRAKRCHCPRQPGPRLTYASRRVVLKTITSTVPKCEQIAASLLP
jgi:hypothetical protein